MEGSWAPEAPSGAASWAFFPPRTAKNYADDIKLDTNVVKGCEMKVEAVSSLENPLFRVMLKHPPLIHCSWGTPPP